MDFTLRNYVMWSRSQIEVNFIIHHLTCLGPEEFISRTLEKKKIYCTIICNYIHFISTLKAAKAYMGRNKLSCKQICRTVQHALRNDVSLLSSNTSYVLTMFNTPKKLC